MKIYEFISIKHLLEVSFVVYSSGKYSLFLQEITIFLLLFQYMCLLRNVAKWEMKEIGFLLALLLF